MDSSLNFSVATADVLSMELDRIVFSDLDVGDSVGVRIVVYDGSNTVMDTWYNTYFADNRGCVTLSDLAKVWNSYILYRLRVSGAEDSGPATLIGAIKVEFTYTLEDETTATCLRRIWYSMRKDGMTVSSLNQRHPLLSLRKRTFIDASEPMYIVGPTPKTVTVYVTYLSLTGDVGTLYYNLSATDADTFGTYRNVSPSAVASHLQTGAKLLEYAVAIDGATMRCTYIVDYGHQAQRTEICYLNRWGVYETLWLLGSERWKPERSADFGYAGDEHAALDVVVEDIYETSTGYVNDTVLDQLRDIAASPSIWLWVAAASTWRKITVKSVDFERVRPSNEVRSGMITYQFAEQNI